MAKAATPLQRKRGAVLKDEPDRYTFDYANISATVFFCNTIEYYLFIPDLFTQVGYQSTTTLRCLIPTVNSAATSRSCGPEIEELHPKLARMPTVIARAALSIILSTAAVTTCSIGGSWGGSCPYIDFRSSAGKFFDKVLQIINNRPELLDC